MLIAHAGTASLGIWGSPSLQIPKTRLGATLHGMLCVILLGRASEGSSNSCEIRLRLNEYIWASVRTFKAQRGAGAAHPMRQGWLSGGVPSPPPGRQPVLGRSLWAASQSSWGTAHVLNGP